MRAVPALLSLLFLAILSVPAPAADELRAGGRLTNGELSEFHLAVEKHYRVPSKHVVACRARGLRHEEIPVVFHLSSRAKVESDVILDLRASGHSWMSICAHFGLGAEIFHVEVGHDPGPPYGKAYGYYKKRPRSQWASIRLTDDEVTHLVNVKFLAHHHRCSPEVILRKHRKGEHFASLHARVKKEKENKKGRDEPSGGKEKGPGKSKGKGKGGRK